MFHRTPPSVRHDLSFNLHIYVVHSGTITANYQHLHRLVAEGGNPFSWGYCSFVTPAPHSPPQHQSPSCKMFHWNAHKLYFFSDCKKSTIRRYTRETFIMQHHSQCRLFLILSLTAAMLLTSQAEKSPNVASQSSEAAVGDVAAALAADGKVNQR